MMQTSNRIERAVRRSIREPVGPCATTAAINGIDGSDSPAEQSSTDLAGYIRRHKKRSSTSRGDWMYRDATGAVVFARGANLLFIDPLIR